MALRSSSGDGAAALGTLRLDLVQHRTVGTTALVRRHRALPLRPPPANALLASRGRRAPVRPARTSDGGRLRDHGTASKRPSQPLFVLAGRAGRAAPPPAARCQRL